MILVFSYQFITKKQQNYSLAADSRNLENFAEKYTDLK